MEKSILIVSTAIDAHAYDPVCVNLANKGFSPVVYKTDQVISQKDSFSVHINPEGIASIEYRNQSISPHEVSAAWYRKLGSYALPHIDSDRARQLYLRTEISQLHDTIWSLYPENIWLNSPQNIRKADRKLDQLLVAKASGFSIPETYVSNSWQDIENGLCVNDESEIIVKMVRGIISEKESLKALYTKPLDAGQIEKLRTITQPFPGIYQPFLSKMREWRVTVVGDRVFPAAIYTDNSAKDDWRKHQTKDSVRFVSENLPQDLEEKCVEYLRRMGLLFGCFDFIEPDDSEIVFLECNPNGQYGWLEEELNFPISDAITDELINIAT